jgi:hypothetical protein
MEDFNRMTRIRVFLFTALAAIVAFGVCGQPAQAQDIQVVEDAHDSMTAVGHWVPNASPDAAALAQGPVLWDNGVQEPPCFGPNAPCSGDPAGGVNIGYALPYWPVSGAGTGKTCTNVKKQACGQIDSFTETTTATGAVSATITIKQGKTVVYSHKATGLGTITAGKILVVSVAGIKLKAAAKAGSAVITVVTTVGTSKSTGKATIYLI